MIAVVNNPDLKAMRDQVGVAEAQAFAAGLLPNPTFSFAYGSLISGVGATTSSVTATLAQDIVPLLTRSVRRQAALANEPTIIASSSVIVISAPTPPCSKGTRSCRRL